VKRLDTHQSVTETMMLLNRGLVSFQKSSSEICF